MPRPKGKLNKHQGSALTAPMRRWLLMMIAHYKKDDWISDELLKRFKVTLQPSTIAQHYRYNHKYRAQIQSYRDKWNKQINDDPGMSKRYIVNLLTEGMEDALKAGDAKGLAALAKQHKEYTGHKVSETVEVNHNHSGGLTLEAKLGQLTANAPKPPAALLENMNRSNTPIPMQYLEVQADKKEA